MTPPSLTVLGIETSCDETAAAVVRWGEGRAAVLSSVVLSQDAAHAPFGGVVPEIAARSHVEAIDGVVARALAEAGLGVAELDGVAATAGPGLVGGVMVGLAFAKAVAVARGLPLIAVNHLEGHALSPRLEADFAYPYLLLLVSGGHCQLLDVGGIGACQRLGSTIDDAAGEAFDKIGVALGLDYPAGPALERLAEGGDGARFALPRPMDGREGSDFSFSGLKTAAARLAARLETPAERRDLAAGVQAEIARQLAERTGRAMTLYARAHPGEAPAPGDRRRGGGQSPRPRRARGAGGRTRLRLRRPAAGLVHRQRGDDRAGRRGTLGGGPDQSARRRRPAALAAGRDGRAAASDAPGRAQGSEGVKVGREDGAMKRVGIIGGGAWGTALAQVARRAGLDVILWARESEVAEAIATRHENPMFLPGVALDPAIAATTRLADVSAADFILAVAPAQHLRAVLGELAADLRPATPIVICAKGIEQGTLALMSEVVADSAPSAARAVLSGPSFAAEVAAGLPTAVTLAAADPDLARTLAEAIASPAFRPYVSADMIGAEAGGAIKNVLAIACGVAEGRAMGRSAIAALITRGFAELTRLAVALGGEAETVAGLCGLGDLVLTCSSPLSRNMSLGMALGRGESLAAALAGKLSVAEGAASAPAVVALAQRLGVEVPICAAVSAILAGDLAVADAIAALLARPLRRE